MGVPNVLFVCVENSCRSQMAEGFGRELGQGVIRVYSAGFNPSGVVNPMAIKIMAEKGIDLSKTRSKGFADLPLRDFDFVVTMGCGDVCPFVPAKQYSDWNIEDPKGKDDDFFRRTRDAIEAKVRQLIAEQRQE